jgi:hypothetical protein
VLKFDRNKKILLLANLILVGLILLFAFLPRSPKRMISSLENDHDISVDALSMSWHESEVGLVFEVKAENENLCENWATIKVVFRAEGIAYSGEVDRVARTTFCEDNKFQQNWVPNLSQADSQLYQKQGLMMEEPPNWVVEQVIFDGPGGQKIISAQELVQRYGSIPTLTPK